MKRIHDFKSFLNEGTTANDILDQIVGLQMELKDLRAEKANIANDMDLEAGQKGDEWSDEDGNRYGKMLNDKDKEIDDIKSQIEKLSARYNKMTASKPKKEKTQEDVIKSVLLKNKEDIQRSRTSWPDRTVKEEAEIYKKRYGINADVAAIEAVLVSLKSEDKL